MLVSVVIPLFNEEPEVFGLLDDLALMGAALERLQHRVEFILVDDGSTDGTAFALSVKCRGRRDLRVVAHPVNRGFGAALRTGVEAARGSVIVCCDADRPYPPGDAALLVEAVQGPEGADVATVSPWATGGRVTGVPMGRVLLSRGASLLYRIVLGRRARGLTCFTASFRAYKGEVLRGLPFGADDFLAPAEIMSRAVARGLRVIEIPATLVARRTGTSKLRVLRTVGRHLGLLTRIALGRNHGPPLEEPGGVDSALR